MHDVTGFLINVKKFDLLISRFSFNRSSFNACSPSDSYIYAGQIENTCVMRVSLEIGVTIDALLQILPRYQSLMIQLGNKLLINDSISGD